MVERPKICIALCGPATTAHQDRLSLPALVALTIERNRSSAAKPRSRAPCAAYARADNTPALTAWAVTALASAARAPARRSHPESAAAYTVWQTCAPPPHTTHPKSPRSGYPGPGLSERQVSKTAQAAREEIAPDTALPRTCFHSCGAGTRLSPAIAHAVKHAADNHFLPASTPLTTHPDTARKTTSVVARVPQRKDRNESTATAIGGPVARARIGAEPHPRNVTTALLGTTDTCTKRQRSAPFSPFSRRVLARGLPLVKRKS